MSLNLKYTKKKPTFSRVILSKLRHHKYDLACRSPPFRLELKK